MNENGRIEFKKKKNKRSVKLGLKVVNRYLGQISVKGRLHSLPGLTYINFIPAQRPVKFSRIFSRVVKFWKKLNVH